MEGIELGAVEPWLRARLPAARPPFRLERLAGGRSNLTFLLADAAGGEWVLRRPPLGPRQATAHDVARGPDHGRARSHGGAGARGAWRRARPLPRWRAAAADGARPVRRRARPPAHARAGLALAETLAALHAVEPADVGLGDLGRGEGYVERQLARWHR